MKFTKEEAFEKLKGLLTNDGKKALRMSERSINAQLDTLLPLIATDDMELSDFVEKVKVSFSTMNSNAEKDNADFVKQWEKDHPQDKKNPTDDKPKDRSGDNAMEQLLKRMEELEKKEMERSKETQLLQKKNELLSAMKEKGIKDEQWAQAFVAEIAITDDMDVNAKAEAYLKIYNKSKASQGGRVSPYAPNSSGDGQHGKDPLEAVRKLVEQRNKEREQIINEKNI